MLGCIKAGVAGKNRRLLSSAQHLFPLLVTGASLTLANWPWPVRIPLPLALDPRRTSHSPSGILTRMDARRKKLCFPMKFDNLGRFRLKAAADGPLSLHVENAVCGRSLGVQS